MRILFYFLLAALVFSPIYAFAAGAPNSQNCFKSVREQVVKSPDMVPLSVAYAMNLTPAEVAQLEIQKQKFSRKFYETDGSGNRSFEYEFQVHKGDFILWAQYTFDLAQGTSGSAFSFNLEKEFHVYRRDQGSVYQEASTQTYDSSCQAKVIQQLTTSFQAIDSSQVRVETIENKIDHTPKKTALIVDRDIIKATAFFELTNSAIELRKNRYFNGPEFSLLTTGSSDLAIIQAKLTEAPRFRRYNPIARQIETLKGVQVVLPSAGIDIAMYDSSVENYQVRRTQFGNFSVWAERVSPELWFKDDLGTRKKFVEIEGFKTEDFSSKDLTLVVSGRGPFPTLLNPSQYYKDISVKTAANGEWKMSLHNVAVTTAPYTLPWTEPATPDEQKYLLGSRYIQLNLVSDLVAKVREKITPTTDRLVLAQTIADVVVHRISYDHSSVSNGVVDLRTTADILATGKGVCQHYAVLFAAVARSMGLPTRIVSGFAVSSTRLTGHAWVEVKLNSSIWWPLDPQVIANVLQDRSYLPTGEMREYEVESDTVDGRLTAQIKSSQIDMSWMGTKITKGP